MFSPAVSLASDASRSAWGVSLLSVSIEFLFRSKALQRARHPVVIVSIHCALSGQASCSGQQQVSVAAAGEVVVRYSRYGKRLNTEKTD